MIRLRKMDEKGFEDFRNYTNERYAQEMSQAFELPLETARKTVTARTDEELSQRLDTPGRFIYYIERQTNSETVCIGYLSYSYSPSETFAWLNGIDIFEPYRNQGVGTQVLALLEKELKENGIKSISSLVDAHNERGLAFCINTGFKFTGHNIKKGFA